MRSSIPNSFEIKISRENFCYKLRVKVNKKGEKVCAFSPFANKKCSYAFFGARLRSPSVRKRLRIRTVSGVTSMSSSSWM